MSQLIETATAIIGNEMRRVESLAQNLANIATPAYKQQLPFQQALKAADPAAGPVEAPVQGTPSVASWSDWRAGALVGDGNPLHVALMGAGWFELNTPTGAAYTRHGAFRIDERGRLVSVQGHPVSLEGGSEADLRGRNVHIAADGALIEDGRSIGRLRVLDFKGQATLQRTADGLFRARGGQAVEAEESTLRTGALEASNVASADNMVRLMESMRRAELGQKLAHAYDDMLGRALRAAGE
jgi:flagellar basal-body rod protein FlgF